MTLRWSVFSDEVYQKRHKFLFNWNRPFGDHSCITSCCNNLDFDINHPSNLSVTLVYKHKQLCSVCCHRSLPHGVVLSSPARPPVSEPLRQQGDTAPHTLEGHTGRTTEQLARKHGDALPSGQQKQHNDSKTDRETECNVLNIDFPDRYCFKCQEPD